jgi:hypothetical protein
MLAGGCFHDPSSGYFRPECRCPALHRPVPYDPRLHNRQTMYYQMLIRKRKETGNPQALLSNPYDSASGERDDTSTRTSTCGLAYPGRPGHRAGEPIETASPHRRQRARRPPMAEHDRSGGKRPAPAAY